MRDRFDEVAKRLAAINLEHPGGGASRRSFLSRIARTTAALGAGLIGASSIDGAAARRQCIPPKTKYRVASKDGVVTDALGTRFVRKGDYIVLDTPEGPTCTGDSGGVSPDNTAGECGISYYYPGISYTYLAASWSELVCRDCPWQGSTIRASFTSHTDPIYISYASEAGQFICRGLSYGYGSSVWYRTSGPIGCWFWSGGTVDPVWNEYC
jgi:hypothetical protein